VRKGGRSPLDYLASVQARDGHYRYSSSSDQTPVWVTGQALMALSGAALPLAPVPREASAAPPPVAGAAPKPAKGGSPGSSSKPSGQKAPTPAAPAPSADPPAEVPLAPTSSGSDGEDDGGIPAWPFVIAAVAAAGGAVWGGWILYRRRLPGQAG
jgi:hypothetical protein